jgi:hypothetical protein
MRVRAHSVVITLLALIGLAAATFFALRWRDKNSFDTWIGKQILGIVSSYLEPTIDFASLRYHSPHTVELKGVSLTAPDGTRVSDISEVTIELARTPVIGEPIQISKVLLTGAAVHLVETSRARFKGLHPFLRAKPGEENAKKIPGNFQLSTVLQLEKVEIRDSAVDYVPSDGSPPMALDGLTLALNVSQAPTAEPGWYGIDTSFGRPPQCTVSANGAISLDTLVARLDSGELSIDISPATIASLPPRLQEIVRRYDAKGRFKLALRGTVPILTAMGSDMSCNITMDSFSLSSGDYVFPIDSGTGSITFKDGKASLSRFVLNTLSGQMRASGIADLSRPDRRTDLAWQINHVDLRALLRCGGESGKPPKLAGILNGSGNLRTSLDSPRESVSGAGIVTVREGRLLVIPGLKELAEFFNAARGLDSGEMRHRGIAKFKLTPAGIVITESEVTTEFAVARATGLVGFDKHLDLYFNAGPLEKLQSMMGAVGRAFGKFTDTLVTYHVHGRIGDTNVDVLPLGIGS